MYDQEILTWFLYTLYKVILHRATCIWKLINYIYIKNSMLHNNLACIRGIKTKI